MAKPTILENFPEELRRDFGPYAAVVERVWDGDTVLVTASAGFDRYPCVWVRLLGVEAPELDEPFGHEARDFLSRLLPHGTPCVLLSEKMPRTGGQVVSFARYVGTLHLTGRRNVNEMANVELECLRAERG